MDIQERLRRRIRKLRLHKGLTVTRLAADANLSSGTYCSFESGRRGLSVNSLYRVVKALGVDISEVWPHDRKLSKGATNVRAISTAEMNFFRLREIWLQSGAESAALLIETAANIRTYLSINLENRASSQLEQLICEDVLDPSWSVRHRTCKNKVLYLALKNAVLDEFLMTLVDFFLTVWDASIVIADEGT